MISKHIRRAKLLSFYGNSLADGFPTHPEQFNQISIAKAIFQQI
ncbi:hypothetical protein [Desmonostoc muscorum]|nr:hypothetical protein [Desmonostoc muscorum]